MLPIHALNTTVISICIPTCSFACFPFQKWACCIQNPEIGHPGIEVPVRIRQSLAHYCQSFKNGTPWLVVGQIVCCPIPSRAGHDHSVMW
ncbi:uncharacterized protein BJ171DRAFT_187436 [Polychytrium aggregatum]|uniref:uncharacterized protein n=1 Tax=Polychytrium aggregatum TaxID=110093 RepID=UPI0022FEB708|nr:uncharacterized protein BJ171DRAFT_187436 [Polychytrium aggregatum]KAI9202206.1 hypothetical protein BJ171DRAFT_187436 [Polychytrium aggregatum]